VSIKLVQIVEKVGRRGFHQSILTYHIKPMCAVKTNIMPKILSEEITRCKTIVQNAVLYLYIVFRLWWCCCFLK